MKSEMDKPGPDQAKPYVVRAAKTPPPAQARFARGDRPLWMRLAVLGALSLYVIGAVLVASKWQWVCAFLLLAGWAGILFWEKDRAWDVLKIILVAAVLGMAGEWLCVHKFHLWEYHFPVFKYGLPVWIGLVWGYLYAVYILIAEVFERGWQRFGEPVKHFLSIAFGVAFFLFLREVYMRIDVYISYYYILFLAVGLTLWRTPMDCFTLIVAGAGGTIGEYLAIQNGLWSYTSPAFPATGMPISLPLAWGLAAVFVRNAAIHFRHAVLWLAVGFGVLYGILKVI